jgi:hypothetical protein
MTIQKQSASLALKCFGIVIAINAGLNFGYASSALRQISQGEIFEAAIGLLMLLCWLLRGVVAVGAFLKKPWAWTMAVAFTVVSPVSGLLLLPFLGAIVPGDSVMCFIWLVGLNAVVTYALRVATLALQPEHQPR